MTLLSADSFDRPDSATLGSTDGAGTLDPLVWANISPGAGQLGIVSNHAAKTSSSVTRGLAVVDVGTADVDISLTFRDLANTGEGIIIRASDSSNRWEYVYSTHMILRRIVGGSLGSGDITTTATPIAGYVIRIVARGDNWWAYMNGVLLGTLTHSFNSTVTTHGLEVGVSTTAPEFDDFSIHTPPGTGWYVGQIGLSG